MAGRKRQWAPGSASVIDNMWRPGGPALTLEAKAIYTLLFSYMDEWYKAKPKVGTLAAGTGMSERAVRYKLQELEDAGLLRREYRPRQGRKPQLVLYHLRPPWEASTLQEVQGEQEQDIDNPAPGAALNQLEPASELGPPGTNNPAQLSTSLQGMQGELSTSLHHMQPPPAPRAAMEVTNVGSNLYSSILPEEEAATFEVASSVWMSCLQEMDQGNGLNEDQRWVRNTRPTAFDGTTITVAIAGEFARDRMESRYGRAVREIVSRLTGNRLQVEFVAKQERRSTANEGDRLGGNLDGAR